MSMYISRKWKYRKQCWCTPFSDKKDLPNGDTFGRIWGLMRLIYRFEIKGEHRRKNKELNRGTVREATRKYDREREKFKWKIEITICLLQEPTTTPQHVFNGFYFVLLMNRNDPHPFHNINAMDLLRVRPPSKLIITTMYT